MKNYQETMEILEGFYTDCERYWRKQNPKLSKIHALQDLRNIKYNPYSPAPEPIDLQAKADFIDKIVAELEL